MMSRVGSKTVAPAPMTPSSPKKRDICSSTLLLKNNDCSSQLPSFCMWNVKDDVSLPVLPLYYPLQKSSVEISDGSLPSQVAFRISDCLRRSSVAVSYDDDKVMARAETSDHTKFDIRLFTPKENSKTIIMEIQRYSGSSMSFHQCYRLIRQAVTKNKDTILPPSKRTKNNGTSVALLQSESSVNSNQGLEEGLDMSLEVAANLLNKDRLDANLLGIQSLRLLTDDTYQTTSDSTAARVANALFDRAPSARYSSLHYKIMSLIKHSRLNDDERSTDEEDYFDRVHYDKMRNDALAVFANSLAVLALSSNSSSFDSATAHQTRRCRFYDADDNELLLKLVQIMKECDCKPHDAYLATRCINMLLKHNDAICKETLLELGLLDAVKYSQVVGQCGHVLLEKESKGLLFALEN
eukprot:CAMPEP_0172488160 /NCGR_PEP_ID=MMETSP1066-20121228/17552_1 /TAXON_ID=671091 /ORGANISM="Coscinodiscus wailesii, Strain CCMP2513" /LENGTH=409 /DNA_ID=CAMNT_0013255207 /DNA_START=318 /DNA_END=1547 /DNA_ORIENTATION=+